VRLGLVYLQNGKKERAIASWKAALELDPDNSEAKALLEKHGQDQEEVATDDLRTAK
jgi:cytochrome c-type biogenesis protein CcmH/NrfG